MRARIRSARSTGVPELRSEMSCTLCSAGSVLAARASCSRRLHTIATVRKGPFERTQTERAAQA
eukprot:6212169-Pleurochrysis_carterae.AAC.4